MPAPEGKSKFMPLVLAILLIGLAAGVTCAAFQLDGWIRARTLAAEGREWKKSPSFRTSSLVSQYGDWPELMGLGLAGLLVARVARNRDWQRILITAMVASTVAGTLVNAVRLTTGRSRPRESPQIAEGWYGPYHDGAFTIGNSKYNSFPSGHTATAVGFAGVILFARPLLGSMALIVALGIGWSRIVLGAHHLSDVTVASIIALAIAWLAWRIAGQRGDDISRWWSRRFPRKS